MPTVAVDPTVVCAFALYVYTCTLYRDRRLVWPQHDCIMYMHAGWYSGSVHSSALCFSLQEKCKYELVSGQWKSNLEVISLYSDLLTSHPGLMGFIDPLHPKVCSIASVPGCF